MSSSSNWRRAISLIARRHRIFTAASWTVGSTLKTRTTLVLAPDGPLWNLPFQALLLPDGRHLLERQAVFYAPSLTFLREHRRQPRNAGGANNCWPSQCSTAPADAANVKSASWRPFTTPVRL